MSRTGERGSTHRDAIVIDMICPLLVREQYIDEWIAGGATCAGATVASDHTLVQTMDQIAIANRPRSPDGTAASTGNSR